MKTPRFVQKALAKMVANMMYKPSGIARPSRKTVMTRESKSQGMDLEAVYSEFETEVFTLANDGIEIPAEYHPVPDAKGVAIEPVEETYQESSLFGKRFAGSGGAAGAVLDIWI